MAQLVKARVTTKNIKTQIETERRHQLQPLDSTCVCMVRKCIYTRTGNHCTRVDA